MKFELNQAVDSLKRTPTVLRVLLKDLPEEWTHTNEGPETWSPFDVLGHLIHGEKTDWVLRANIILSDKEDKNFESFDRFAQFKDSLGKTLEDLLDEFEQLRKENLKAILTMNLKADDFIKEGIHPEFGPVNLKQLLSTWVVHDLGHIAQISRVMAKQYFHEVGPWTKYLNILKG